MTVVADTFLVLNRRRRRAPHHEQSQLQQPDKQPAHTGTEDSAIYDSIVATCDQTNTMALPTKVWSCGLSLALDIGATVNVLSEELFQALMRSFFSGQWLLRRVT